MLVSNFMCGQVEEIPTHVNPTDTTYHHLLSNLTTFFHVLNSLIFSWAYCILHKLNREDGTRLQNPNVQLSIQRTVHSEQQKQHNCG